MSHQFRPGLLGIAIVTFIARAVLGEPPADFSPTKPSASTTRAARGPDDFYALAMKEPSKGIAMIADVPTPEATLALLALLDTTDVERQKLVLEALTRRLPIPAYPDRECPFTDLRTEERRKLSAKAWKSDFVPEARAFARWLLRQEDVHLSKYGARIITCVGTLEDTPQVIEAMDRILDETSDPEAKPGYMPRWFDPFLMASQGQTYRGAPDIANLKTSGEIVVYVGKLLTHRQHRPEGWESKCKDWLNHPVPYIRKIAAFTLSKIQ